MERKEKEKLPIVERDLSWMYFNHRILQEAGKKDVPVVERLSFLGIYSNNLDEFFRVRVASLNRIAEAKEKSIKADREKAKETIKAINKLNGLFNREYEEMVEQVTEKLKDHGIRLMHEGELNAEQRDFVRRFYLQKLNGNTNPIWLSNVKEIDNEGDESIWLAIKCYDKTESPKRQVADYALIKVPTKEVGRFVRIPSSDGFDNIMYLDDVIRCCLPLIFIGCGKERFEAYSFKFTKDAEMEMDNDLNSGTMQKVQQGIKSRKSGEPIRVIYDAGMPRDLYKKIMARIGIGSLDTLVTGGRYQNHKDLMQFPGCGKEGLNYPVWNPIQKKEFDTEEFLLDIIRRKDRFIHVPYHSFDPFIRLLREAALSKDVREISVTLYRLARESKVVKALICAAKNGKRVRVVIELLARFDEESNIKWSKKLKEAGAEVVFGVEGLKVHSKLVHIACKGGDIACVGSGNFHEGNAKTYTDYLMMTARPQIVREVRKVFDFIEKPFAPVAFRELLVSPNEMKPKILRMIMGEIKNAKMGKEAWIKVKINHITDEDIIAKLYEASSAGVKIDLLVRGNCSLIPGLPGISENMRAIGIIDRYLEHSRILIFANGGENRYYFGSADWMPRNLVNRIEVMSPVYDPDMRRDLMRTVDYGMNDSVNGRIIDGRGSNIMLGDSKFFEGEHMRSQVRLRYEYEEEENGSGE